MKKYELKYTTGEDGVFRMSTVENPATHTTLVMFDDEFKLLEFKDDEKQVIYSVAMRPDMLIPRKNINGEPAMVFYTEDTVRDLQQNFFKNNSHNGATVNHDKKVRNDMYCFESWIVEDPDHDKAKTLGLDVKKGDWVLAQKVDNPEVWKDIKDGKLNGFSIEAYLEPVLIKEEIKMGKQDLKKALKIVLMEEESEAYKVGEETIYIDKIEEGGLVQDDEADPVDNETIKVDGFKIKTDSEGIITEVEEIVENEEEDGGEELMKKQAEIDDLKAEILDLKAKLAEKDSANVEMSKQLVRAKGINLEFAKQGIKVEASAQIPYEQMTNAQKTKFNRQNK